MSGSSSTPRPRPQRSCLTCSRRKVGCDRAHPVCGRCARAGLPCSYSAGRPAQMPIRFVDETTSLSAASESHATRRSSSSFGIQASLPRRIERLDQMLRSMSFQQEPDILPQGNPNPGHMFIGKNSRTKYVSPAYFALISREVAEINDLLQYQQNVFTTSPSWSRAPPNSASSQRQRLDKQHLYGDIFQEIPAWFGPEQQYSTAYQQLTTITELVALIPPWQCCDLLVWSYLRGFHPMAPMIHVGTFLDQYMEFKQWQTSGRTDYSFNSDWFVLFSAVLFAGSVVCPASKLREAYGPILREAVSSRLYEFAITAIRLSDFPHIPSVQSLSAFIIVDTIWLRDEQPLTCCAFVGLAVRVAQMLGLNRDPGDFPGITFVEAETRRRVWWQVMASDTAVAFAAGLIPIIHPTMWDVRPISELPDSSLSRLNQGQSLTHADQKQTILGILSGGRLRTFVRANVLMRILNSSPLSIDDFEDSMTIVAQIQQDLAECINRITEIEPLIPADQNDLNADHPPAGFVEFSESNPRLARWSKSFLSLLSMRPHHLVYGPFRQAGYLSKYFERVPDAKVYNKRFLYGFLTLCQTPDFQPFHWSWPGQHQPLHAILAILEDLEDQPQHITARETRKLIDLAVLMSSSGPDGNFGNADVDPAPAEASAKRNGMVSSGIIAETAEGDAVLRPLTEGGNGAWEFVRKRRDMVWRKSGIDPSVLLCPSRASDIDLELAISGVSAAGTELSFSQDNQSPSSDDGEQSFNFGERQGQPSAQTAELQSPQPYASASTSTAVSNTPRYMPGTAEEQWTLNNQGGFFPFQEQLQQQLQSIGDHSMTDTGFAVGDDVNYGTLAETDSEWMQFAGSLDPFSLEHRSPQSREDGQWEP